VAEAKTVTVFVYSFPTYRSQDNNVYLDDASLTVATSRLLPTPTPRPTGSAAEGAPAARTPIPAGSDAPFAGILAGSRGGSYAKYEFVAPNAAPMTLRVSIWPFDGIIANATGFEVYGPTGQVVASSYEGSANTAVATFTPVAGGTYLVQIYNYLDGTPISYTLTRR